MGVYEGSEARFLQSSSTGHHGAGIKTEALQQRCLGEESVQVEFLEYLVFLGEGAQLNLVPSITEQV